MSTYPEGSNVPADLHRVFFKLRQKINCFIDFRKDQATFCELVTTKQSPVKINFKFSDDVLNAVLTFESEGGTQRFFAPMYQSMLRKIEVKPFSNIAKELKGSSAMNDLDLSTPTEEDRSHLDFHHYLIISFKIRPLTVTVPDTSEPCPFNADCERSPKGFDIICVTTSRSTLKVFMNVEDFISKHVPITSDKLRVPYSKRTTELVGASAAPAVVALAPGNVTSAQVVSSESALSVAPSPNSVSTESVTTQSPYTEPAPAEPDSTKSSLTDSHPTESPFSRLASVEPQSSKPTSTEPAIRDRDSPSIINSATTESAFADSLPNTPPSLKRAAGQPFENNSLKKTKQGVEQPKEDAELEKPDKQSEGLVKESMPKKQKGSQKGKEADDLTPEQKTGPKVKSKEHEDGKKTNTPPTSPASPLQDDDNKKKEATPPVSHASPLQRVQTTTTTTTAPAKQKRKRGRARD